jgi:tetratricopeptide (TPR) repeat protein/tRNA A-37 threonylcarbamoyl transferase component Bud32
MHEVWICPRGHRWELSREPAGTASNAQATCPICAAETMPGPGPATAVTIEHDLVREQPPAPTRVWTDSQPASPAIAAAAAPPDVIAGYEILGVLGRGGMGVVYKARQRGLDRTVAIKMILAGAHAGAEEIARFHTEANAVAQLQHPNIVQIYEVGEEAGCPYFSLEFVDGVSLTQKLAGTPLPPREAARLAEPLARGMHWAHQRGIVHRDLKPGNVLLTADGTPKITDFGLAKRVEADSSQTRTGAVLGTPSYMAPEQAMGKTREVGPAADVYALGAILYEMLTGRPPFRAATMMETLLQVQYEEPLAPCRLNSQVPADLETICLKCLEKMPSKRYGTALDLAEDLRRFQAGEPIVARPIRTWERVAKWARRRPTAAALVGLGVFSTAGGILAALAYTAQLQHYNVQLAAAAERAREQSVRAERNFGYAREAVQRMLTRVADELLLDVPQSEPVRRAILEEALGYYQKFLQERSDDPKVRSETGSAFHSVAEICRLLGDRARSQQAYEQAVAIFGQLMIEFPAQPDYAEQLADSYNSMGELLRISADPETAEPCYLNALQTQQRLARDFPGQLNYQMKQARTQYNLGILYKDSGRSEAAQRAYHQAIVLLQDLVSRDPQIAAYRRELARALVNQGILLRATNQPSDAELAYNEAITIYRALVDQHPNKTDYRHEYASSCVNLGNLLLLLDRNRREQATEAYSKALKLFQALADDSPQVPVYRKELANCYNSVAALLKLQNQAAAAKNRWDQARKILDKLAEDFPNIPDYSHLRGGVIGNLGSLAYDEGDLVEAQRLLEQAITCHQAALASNPQHPAYRSFLRTDATRLGRVFLHRGDHAKVAEVMAVLADHLPGNLREYVRAASLLGQCILLARDDLNLAESDRSALTDAYAIQAISLLRGAIALGYDDLQELEHLPDFQSLRVRQDFQDMVEAVRTRAQSVHTNGKHP